MEKQKSGILGKNLAFHYSNIPSFQSRIQFRERHSSIPYILFWDFVEDNSNLFCWNLKHLDNSIRHFLNELLLLLRCPSCNHADLNDGHLFLLSFPLTLPLSTEGRGRGEGVMGETLSTRDFFRSQIFLTSQGLIVTHLRSVLP